MNKDSLDRELEKLSSFVKKVAKGKIISNNSIKKRTAAYTITGMIEVINTLIGTGAYNIEGKDSELLYESIRDARAQAIHNSKSDQLDIMLEHALKITGIKYDQASTILAERLNSIIINENIPYLLISSTSDVSIEYDDSIHTDCFKYTNKKTGEKLYMPRSELVILENNQTGNLKYLVKLDTTKSFYYKKDAQTRSQIISGYQLNANNFFAPAIKGETKYYNFNTTINRIVTKMLKDPYNNYCISYNTIYGKSKNVVLGAYNVLDNYLKNHVIDEKIALNFKKCSLKPGNFKDLTNVDIQTPDVTTKNDRQKFLSRCSLRDVFFMEYFLKEAKGYMDKVKEAKESGLPYNDYTKLAQLLQIYKNGPSNFSDLLIQANPKFAKLYWDYKDIRNTLAHSPLNERERGQLIDSFELATLTLFDVLKPMYSSYTGTKRAGKPYFGLPIDQKDTINTEKVKIHNKTSKYYLYKHTGDTVVIGKNKYLKLSQKSPNNLYIQVDGTVYAYDYHPYTDYLSCQTCLASEHAHFVQINKSKAVTTYTKPVEKIKDEPVMYDNTDSSLLQAYDYLKSYRQSESDFEFVSTPIITIYNLDTPIYSDLLRNMITRRYHQKGLPRELISACSCVLPKDKNEPIKILDDNNNVVATVFFGVIKNHREVNQVLEDGSEIPIACGQVLPKAADASSITREVSLEEYCR